MIDDLPPGLKLLDPESGHAKVVLEIIRNWLVVAVETEREACAKIADAFAAEPWGHPEQGTTCNRIAAAIRARGQT